MKKYLLLMAFVCLNASANSDWVELKATDYLLWPGVYSSDKIRVQLVGDAISNFRDPSVCASENQTSYFLHPSLPVEVVNRMYDTLLSTKLANKSLRIYITGCDEGRPTIQAIQY